MRNKLLTTAILMACATAASAAYAADDEKTTVGGRLFVDFTNIDQSLNNTDTAAKGTGLDVKRAYLIVDHKFDDIWSANVTTDFNYVANDSETQVFIKKAYLQAKFDDAFILRAGSADLPWVPFVEGLYGYRYVENVMIDRLKFGTSADWGLHAFGSGGDGMFSYAVSGIEGNGYKNPTRSKSIDFEGRAAFVPVKGLTLAAGFYSGKLGKDIEGVAVALQPKHTAERLDFVAAYVTSNFRVGAEYFDAKNWNQVTAVATDKTTGYSAWGSFSFTEQLAVFARYDQAKPRKDLSPDLQNKYFNIGLAYKPRKNIDVAFVVKQDKFNDIPAGVTVTSQNYSTALTGPVGRISEAKHNEIGVWTQVSF
jgi:hypothetical protein